MSDDLYPRIRAAIEERLELARAARHVDGVWTVEPVYRMLKGCRCLSCQEDEPYGWAIHEIDGHGEDASPTVSREIAEHIAAFDPSWAIRALEADLSRLDRHWRNGAACEACWRVTPDATEGVSWPCDEIKLLASVYLEDE